MKAIYSNLIIFLFAIASYAQSTDSLVNELKYKLETATNDSVRIGYKIDLAEQLLNSNADTARALINDVLLIIAKNGDTRYYYKKSKAEALNYLGILDSKQGDAENALSNYLKALNIREEIKDSVGIGFSLNNLGMFYRRQKEYEKAKPYFKKAILIKQKTGNRESLAVSYNMLGSTYYYNKQKDSALYHHLKAKEIATTKEGKAKANGNLATIYFSNKEFEKATTVFKENVAIYKSTNNQNELSVAYQNVAVLYNAIAAYDTSLVYMDSAIMVSKKHTYTELLVNQYYSRSNINETRKDHLQALADYKLYKMYYDSINDTKKAKRITALELNYKFDKEKQADVLRIENEKAKKRLYLLLFIITLVLGIIIFLLTRKNAKQRIELSDTKFQKEQLDKVKAELALVTREKELKKVVIENSLRQEVLNSALSEIKSIIKLENEEERKIGLQSLSASLLSEKVTKHNTSNLQSYLNDVHLDFKVILDTRFPKLNEKERELLSLMTLGLTAPEISKLQNTTVSAIKSTRSRIRKKIGVGSKEDIIAFIKKSNNT